jgi:DinB superfamily
MEFRLDEALEILTRTPSTLRSMLHGLSEAWTTPNEGGESWSPFDIVGHLIHGEETDWISRAAIILEHGESRPFPPVDRFAMFEKFRDARLDDMLDTFERLRTESLRRLHGMSLTPELLERTGMHPHFGIVTLRQLLSTWAVHDLGHIAQIARVMSKQYVDEVGPWYAYLPILHARPT